MTISKSTYDNQLAIDAKDAEFVNELIEQMCDKYGEPATKKFITLLLSTLSENDK